MPVAVVVIGLALFAQGTSELMLAGLLPTIATDLGVSIPGAGLLISAFAVGMLVGAPIMAVLTLRLPRRTALLTFLGVYVLAHVVGALAPGYAFLLVTRVLAAVVYAGFWAVAMVTAIGLVPVERRGRAISIVTGGLTVAMVVGLPLGTLIGAQLGWRSAFWAVALMSVVAMVAVWVTVPAGRPDGDRLPRVADELRAMRSPRLWLAYSTNACATGATLVIFGYLAPMLTEVTGLPQTSVPAVLFVYGIGTILGLAVGGRTTDSWPTATLVVSLAAFAAVAVALGFTMWAPVPTIVLVALLGAMSFTINPGLNARVFAFAGEAPTLASATNTSAFNLGIMIGPALGAILLSAGLGYQSLTWAGAGLAVLALGTVVALRPAVGAAREPAQAA